MQRLAYVNNISNHEGLKWVNDQLINGWKVVMISPMSGAGDTDVCSALVLIEKE